jgi:hypothetical protein
VDIKRDIRGAKPLRRYAFTLIMAAMHRLSELAHMIRKG